MARTASDKTPFATIATYESNNRNWRLIVRGNKFIAQYQNCFGEDTVSWNTRETWALTRLQSEVERQFKLLGLRYEIECSLTNWYCNPSNENRAMHDTLLDEYGKLMNQEE